MTEIASEQFLDAALEAARTAFDGGAFERRLADLVARKSSSQDEDALPGLHAYLTDGLSPWLEEMGFSTEIFPNPESGAGPIMVAERIEPDAPLTVLSYAHGDTVAGLDAQWSIPSGPWRLHRDGDRWYGRGAADNKGQHAINLFALEQVLRHRSVRKDGRLGFSIKLVVETAEERGSQGLATFVAQHAERLKADVMIASDGPRVSPETPTVAAGSRGSFTFDLAVRLRKGGVHSGHWGGVTTDPAVILTHALASIVDRRGCIQIDDWLPPLTPGERSGGGLSKCPVDPGDDAATVVENWGEPGLTVPEKRYAWNAFIVLAMTCGRPEAPMNAVAPSARATCQIRYEPGSDPTKFMPALRKHLDDAGFENVAIENAGITMPASATETDHPWIVRVATIMEKTLGRHVQVIPAVSGGMPGYAFTDTLRLPLVWVPHGHNGCKQHGPDEHMLVPIAREGVEAFVGLWWRLGDSDGGDTASTSTLR
ncbi:M20/M25/M40 family metallo-hydrolase [Acetobacter sacchari]|uniref:M20/M25/M40 family metallo-hydrolase n=1 Tax=Acetobacter sacchari TaxID=2661687 RepID=A0ABS3LV65_9PROT|nr:M20/M25/M40 family metallo-hydrolase [Acetobacter sacchari]MBO1359817.1 M20/M25/M40 family metallo-hydrolase [Acetobacter sacchari]